MTPRKLNNSLLFSYLFLYPFSFLAIGKDVERWWVIMWVDVGCVGATTSFIAPRCNNRGGKAAGLRRRGKEA
jgi:hypothetical protein